MGLQIVERQRFDSPEGGRRNLFEGFHNRSRARPCDANA